LGDHPPVPLGQSGTPLPSEEHRGRLTKLVTLSVKNAFGLTLHEPLTSVVMEKGPYAFRQ
jgi:hypothetical protein